MMLALQYVRSAIFVFLMYLAMLVVGILGAPFAIYSKEGAYWVMKRYCDLVLWLARGLCGLRYEIRGQVPSGAVVVASKHQSFMDIILLMHVLPLPKYIMKKEIKWTPVLGLYAMRIGSASVDRGKKGAAMKQMVQGVEKNLPENAQVVIYPQGTRVPPGQTMRYKIGAGVLYERLDLPCVPAATNVGVFWGRKGILRKPGVAVLEFLDPIEPGLPVSDVVAKMEAVIEPASNALMREAGFNAPDS